MKTQMRTRKHTRYLGFTLLEMMIALAILSLILAVIFQNIDMIQKRYNTEDSKTDAIQESREFVDQITRDLATAGFPDGTMYGNPPPSVLSTNRAVGLVAISATDIILEGDVDGDGTVNVIEYQLASNSGNCPCTLKRSVISKDGVTATLSLTPTFNTEVENVLNSTGSGNTPYTITGSDAYGATFDTTYTNYKVYPVFQYLDVTGNTITGIPNDLTTTGTPSNQTTGSNFTLLARVRSVVVTVNVISNLPDQQTHQYPAFSLRGVALILNPKI